MSNDITLDSLDMHLTNAAVVALKSALTAARAHAAGSELANAIDRLDECRLVVTAVRAQVTIELFAPAEGEDGGTLRFFAITAEEEALH